MSSSDLCEWNRLKNELAAEQKLNGETLNGLRPAAFRIELRGEPVAWAQNSSPRAVNGELKFRPIPAKQRNQFSAVRLAAQFVADAAGLDKPLDEPVEMRLRIELRIPKKFKKADLEAARAGRLLPKKTPDSSKVLRLVEDALQGIIYTDDKLIDRHVIEKVYSDQPKTVIEIKPLGSGNGFTGSAE